MIVPPPPPGSNRPQRATCNKCQKNCGAFTSGLLAALTRTERRTKQLWLVGLVCAEAGLRCERIASSTRRETPAYPAIGASVGPPAPPWPPPFFFPHPFFRLFCKGQQSLMYDRMVLPPRAAHPPRFPELSSFAPVMCYVVIIVGRVMRCCVWLTVPYGVDSI